jgi:TatD DNase family protein
MMKLFDSHCHLDDRSFIKDLDQVIVQAMQAGVEKIMVVGITQKSCRLAVKLAENNPGIYASVGIHPHDVKDCTEEVLNDLKKLSQNKKVKAWGETGLDFNRMFSPRALQEKWFVCQIELARELGLPLIFHERDSRGRFGEILKTHLGSGAKGVVQCFSGNKKELFEYISMGLYIGITGIVTIESRGAELRKLVTEIPSDRLLIETDAPYLTPAPQKNQTRRNEPAFVKSVLMKIAEVRKEDPEELSFKIWENTHRVYGISEQ